MSFQIDTGLEAAISLEKGKSFNRYSDFCLLFSDYFAESLSFVNVFFLRVMMLLLLLMLMLMMMMMLLLLLLMLLLLLLLLFPPTPRSRAFFQTYSPMEIGC